MSCKVVPQVFFWLVQYPIQWRYIYHKSSLITRAINNLAINRRHNLVIYLKSIWLGGFNPSKKYQSVGIFIPVHEKSVANHQPAISSTPRFCVSLLYRLKKSARDPVKSMRKTSRFHDFMMDFLGHIIVLGVVGPQIETGSSTQ